MRVCNILPNYESDRCGHAMNATTVKNTPGAVPVQEPAGIRRRRFIAARSSTQRTSLRRAGIVK